LSGGTFGKNVERLEDRDLLTGKGRFVDDIRFPDTRHAAFVRSPHAHALIRGIDTTAARAQPGVDAVFTLAELRPHLTTDRLVVALPTPAFRQQVDRPVLAATEVVHVGEPIAVVVAESRHAAEDAAAQVAIDYDVLPAVVDAEAALAPNAPTAHFRRRVRSRLWRRRRGLRGGAGVSREIPHRSRRQPFDRMPRARREL
jgi:carbon-monoxide dehydrogenase large subunit